MTEDDGEKNLQLGFKKSLREREDEGGEGMS